VSRFSCATTIPLDDDDEATLDRAFDCEGLDAWRDPESPTKTAWIYELVPGFCD
jgi:hypothetical protein